MLRFNRGLLGLSAVAVLVFLINAGAGLAQTGTTSLRGTVTDKSGATVSGANITLTISTQAASRTTVSGPNGDYEFLALTPGTYLMTVEKDGFRKFEQKISSFW